MSIRIDAEKCIGCGRCAEVCPGTLIEVHKGKAMMVYPKDCWGCASCLKECPALAIRYYLAGDTGGNGAYLQADLQGSILHWIIKKPDGTVRMIDTDRTSSNRY